MRINCDKCGKEYYIKPSRFVSRKRHFCSNECRKNGELALCSFCKKPVYRERNEIDKNIKHFCNNECKSSFHKDKNNVFCYVCKKPLYRAKSELNESGMYFCSNECKVRNGNRYTNVVCIICGCIFQKATADLKRYPNHCCSIACRSKFNDKREIVFCTVCNKEFARPPSLLNGKDNVFCSKYCHDVYQDKKVDLTCAKCGTSFRVSPIYASNNISDKYFCSTQCSAKFKYEESYVEKEFSKMLDKMGVKYERNNRTILYPLELDFWIPDIKYAVEINGPTHYKPIFGLSTLNKVKKRDKMKRVLCKQLGIKLRITKPANWRNGVCQKRFMAVIRDIKKEIKICQQI